MNQTSELKMKVLENVGKVIIGKEKEIELLLIAFLSEGHILLEDLPGMGKTMMVRSFSKTLELPFKRIQFGSLTLASILIVSEALIRLIFLSNFTILYCVLYRTAL